MLADVIAVLGGTTAASCLYIAVTIWFLGVSSHSLSVYEQTGVLCFVLFVVLGLLLLSAVAPLSISAKPVRDRRDPSVASPRSARSIVLTEWWRLFRLLSLLAVGPSLIALALATAPTIDPAVGGLCLSGRCVRTPLPSGGQVVRSSRQIRRRPRRRE